MLDSHIKRNPCLMVLTERNVCIHEKAPNLWFVPLHLRHPINEHPMWHGVAEVWIRFALYRETPCTNFESVIRFKAMQMTYNPSRRALVSGSTTSDFWPQVALSLVKASGTSTAWVPSS